MFLKRDSKIYIPIDTAVGSIDNGSWSGVSITNKPNGPAVEFIDKENIK